MKMNYFKTWIFTFIIALIMIVILYLAISFVNYELNPNFWSVDERTAQSILSVVLLILTIPVTGIIEAK